MTALPTPRVPLNAMTEAMLNQELSNEVHRILSLPHARDQVLSAALVATHLHAGQTRFATDGGPARPYIEHPLRNTLRLVRWGLDNPMVLTASLLHDTVEDQVAKIITDYTPGTLPVRAGPEFTHTQVTQMRKTAHSWLALGFGERVATLVERVTNPLHGSYLDHMADLVRAAEQARAIAPDRAQGPATIALQSLLIKASDLVDNAGPLLSQHGRIGGPRIVYLMERYTPAVSMVLGGLHENRAYQPASRALDELAPILDDLKELQGRIYV